MKNVMKLYHRQGCQNYIKCPKNACLISAANTLEHELGKAEICWELSKQKHDFITEAVSNETGDRIDVVDLTNGDEIEIDNKHGNIIELLKKGRIVYKVI